MRYFKCYVAREVYRALLHPSDARQSPGDVLKVGRVSAGLAQTGVAAKLDVESARIG